MEYMMTEFKELEDFLGRKVPILLKLLLYKSGYDSMISIKQIANDTTIKQLERYINKRKNQIFYEVSAEIENLEYHDDSIAVYEKQSTFEFLPGHRAVLLSLPNHIQNMQSQFIYNKNIADNRNTASIEMMEAHTEYSVILQELLQTAKNNYKKSKHAFQYNDIVKYFATYIFMLCGRTCYETLNKNLPIPSTKTICK